RRAMGFTLSRGRLCEPGRGAGGRGDELVRLRRPDAVLLGAVRPAGRPTPRRRTRARAARAFPGRRLRPDGHGRRHGDQPAPGSRRRLRELPRRRPRVLGSPGGRAPRAGLSLRFVGRAGAGSSPPHRCRGHVRGLPAHLERATVLVATGLAGAADGELSTESADRLLLEAISLTRAAAPAARIPRPAPRARRRLSRAG